MVWVVAVGGVGSIAGAEGDVRISEEGPEEIVDGTNRCSVGFAAVYTGVTHSLGNKHLCYKVVGWQQKKVLRPSAEHEYNGPEKNNATVGVREISCMCQRVQY